MARRQNQASSDEKALKEAGLLDEAPEDGATEQPEAEAPEEVAELHNAAEGTTDDGERAPEPEPDKPRVETEPPAMKGDDTGVLTESAVAEAQAEEDQEAKEAAAVTDEPVYPPGHRMLSVPKHLRADVASRMRANLPFKDALECAKRQHAHDEAERAKESKAK